MARRSSASPTCPRQAHRRHRVGRLRDESYRTACGRHRIKTREVPEILLNNLFATYHGWRPCSAHMVALWMASLGCCLSLEMLDAFPASEPPEIVTRRTVFELRNCARTRHISRSGSHRPLANIDGHSKHACHKASALRRCTLIPP